MTDEPGRRVVLYRTIKFQRPRRVHRDSAATIVVWEKTSRIFATAAIAWLVAATVFERSTHPGALPVVALIACALSAAVVIKGRIIVRRAKDALQAQPADRQTE